MKNFAMKDKMPNEPQIRDQQVNGQQVPDQAVKLVKKDFDKIQTESESAIHSLVSGEDKNCKDGFGEELVTNGKMVKAVGAKNVAEEPSYRQDAATADTNGSINQDLELGHCETPSSRFSSNALGLPADLALVNDNPQDNGLDGHVQTDLVSSAELDGGRQRYTKTKGDLRKQLQMKRDMKMQETQTSDVVDPVLSMSSAFSSALSQSPIVPANQVCL